MRDKQKTTKPRLRAVEITLRDGEVLSLRNLPEPFEAEVHNYDQDDPAQLDSVDADGVRFSREQFNPDWSGNPPPPMIELTPDDWVEIYYALGHKVAWVKDNPGRSDERKDTADWLKHLRKIIETIGPDGIAAYINGVAPNNAA